MTAVSPARAHTATLVIVGPSGRLPEAVQTLAEIDQAGGVRGVLLETDAGGSVPAGSAHEVVTISGLKPEFLNNAIAAVRLSSLPTVVWWRGGQPARLDGVASLADRVVLDAEDAAPLWRRAPALFERTAMTDLRWARLTRWRAVMAHFFDLPQVRLAAATFTRLIVTGTDRAQATLFAGWLDSSLGWGGRVAVEITDAAGDAPLISATLHGPDAELEVRLLPNTTCLDTRAVVGGHVLASGVVSLGDQRLPALLSQELRVRSRDVAFERALESTGALGM